MAKQKTPSDYSDGPIMDKIWPESRALLRDYSKIPEQELEKHVRTIRDQAWKIAPYPCIALYLFLRLDLALHPAYDRIVKLLQGPDPDGDDTDGRPRYLELACCLGQNIRKLIFDRIPASVLYGSDLHSEFLDLGFDLFKDRDAFPDPAKHFFPADLFTADSTMEDAHNPWQALEGKFRVINATSLLHLFDYETQLRACCIISRLLDRQPGSVFTGSQLGRSEPGDTPRQEFKIRSQDGGQYAVRNRYLHSPSSFAGLWKEVERRTGITFHVEAQLSEMRRPDGATALNTPNPTIQEFRKRIGTNEVLTFTVSVAGSV